MANFSGSFSSSEANGWLSPETGYHDPSNPGFGQDFLLKLGVGRPVGFRYVVNGQMLPIGVTPANPNTPRVAVDIFGNPVQSPIPDMTPQGRGDVTKKRQQAMGLQPPKDKSGSLDWRHALLAGGLALGLNMLDPKKTAGAGFAQGFVNAHQAMGEADYRNALEKYQSDRAKLFGEADLLEDSLDREEKKVKEAKAEADSTLPKPVGDARKVILNPKAKPEEVESAYATLEDYYNTKGLNMPHDLDDKDLRIARAIYAHMDERAGQTGDIASWLNPGSKESMDVADSSLAVILGAQGGPPVSATERDALEILNKKIMTSVEVISKEVKALEDKAKDLRKRAKDAHSFADEARLELEARQAEAKIAELRRRREALAANVKMGRDKTGVRGNSMLQHGLGNLPGPYRRGPSGPGYPRR